MLKAKVFLESIPTIFNLPALSTIIVHYLEDLNCRELGCQPLFSVNFGSSICLPLSFSRFEEGSVSGVEGASGSPEEQLAVCLASPEGSRNICKVASLEPDAAKAGDWVVPLVLSQRQRGRTLYLYFLEFSRQKEICPISSTLFNWNHCP